MSTRPERYSDIFRLRGAAYDAAMTDWPQALEEEMDYLVDLLDLVAGERVLDLGAAGGYLAPAVSARNAAYTCVDSSEVLNGFAQQRGLDAHLSPLQTLPFKAQHFDALVAQAALHHETEWNTIFCEARRVAKPGARLVVGEVAEGSPVAGFLDVFVNRHNPLGHSGRFANDAFVDAIREAGWTIRADFRREYCWRCPSRSTLFAFLSRLFYMPALDEATLIEGIHAHLGGLRESPDGVCMPWGMRVIVAHNPA